MVCPAKAGDSAWRIRHGQYRPVDRCLLRSGARLTTRRLEDRVFYFRGGDFYLGHHFLFRSTKRYTDSSSENTLGKPEALKELFYRLDIVAVLLSDVRRICRTVSVYANVSSRDLQPDADGRGSSDGRLCTARYYYETDRRQFGRQVRRSQGSRCGFCSDISLLAIFKF